MGAWALAVAYLTLFAALADAQNGVAEPAASEPLLAVAAGESAPSTAATPDPFSRAAEHTAPSLPGAGGAVHPAFLHSPFSAVGAPQASGLQGGRSNPSNADVSVAPTPTTTPLSARERASGTGTSTPTAPQPTTIGGPAAADPRGPATARNEPSPHGALPLFDAPSPTGTPALGRGSVTPDSSAGVLPEAVPGLPTGAMPGLSARSVDPRTMSLHGDGVTPLARAVRTSNGTTAIQGTLWLPPGTGPFPAVVLVDGSGDAAPSRTEADARLFVQAGVAAYRYSAGTAAATDARAGTPAGAGWRIVPTVDDLVGNAVAAVQAVRRSPGVDPERVGVWGVGKGGWILPFVGREADVAFLILVNATTTPLAQQEMLTRGSSMEAAGASDATVRATVRGMQLAYSARPVLTRIASADRLGALAEDPRLSPAAALATSQAPMLALFDGGGASATVASAAALRTASRGRDQPYDVVTVLDQAPHAFGNAGRTQDPAYRTTVAGWTRTVVSGGAVQEPLDPEAVQGMTRGFPPLAARAGGAEGAASGTGEPRTVSAGPAAGAAAGARGAAGRTGPPAVPSWFSGAERGTPWYATAWFQLPVLVVFVAVFTAGLIASLLPLGRIGRARAVGGARVWKAVTLRGSTVTGARPVRSGALLRITQGLLCLVDLGLLAGLSITVLELLGIATPTLPTLGETLRALSAASGGLALFLALLLLFAPRTGWRPRRTGLAVGVALAAALFLPFLLYWQLPFLAG